MFTGITEEVGTIKNFDGTNIEIECAEILNGTKIGDSISINGVCETVTELSAKTFSAKISPETLSVTTFKSLKNGDEVNLERALTLNTHLGGHLVTGHVDCRARLTKFERLEDFYDLTFEIPEKHSKYIVYKGSITINGISLTVAKIEKNSVCVAIIPHTYRNTNLKNLKAGDEVNIETDIIGKYVEKMLSARNNEENHISMEFLAENGFV